MYVYTYINISKVCIRHAFAPILTFMHIHMQPCASMYPYGSGTRPYASIFLNHSSVWQYVSHVSQKQKSPKCPSRKMVLAVSSKQLVRMCPRVANRPNAPKARHANVVVK